MSQCCLSPASSIPVPIVDYHDRGFLGNQIAVDHNIHLRRTGIKMSSRLIFNRLGGLRYSPARKADDAVADTYVDRGSLRTGVINPGKVPLEMM